MAFSYTYTQLKDAIVEWLEEDSEEFQDALDQVVNNAEIQLIKDLNFSIFDQSATGTLTSATLTKPVNALEILHVFITVSGAQVLLEPKPWDYVQQYGGTGTPIYYAETSTTTLTVAPAPTSQAYTVRYIQRPTPLSETTGATTTWLSANVPDALFFGSLIKAHDFLKNDERLATAKDQYAMALATAQAELSRLIRREYGK